MHEEVVGADKLQAVLLGEFDWVPATSLLQRRSVLLFSLRHCERLCAGRLLEEEEGCTLLSSRNHFQGVEYKAYYICAHRTLGGALEGDRALSRDAF